MGRLNYLIEGLSGTGKTSVGDELQRRGLQAVHGDRELAYQGDPASGEPTQDARHEHHIWDVNKVRALAADRDQAVTFFCGGSRNFSKFIELFDERPDECGDGRPTARDLLGRCRLGTSPSKA